MSKKRPKGRLDFGKYDEIQLQKIEVPAEPDTTLSLKLICQERHSTSKCSYHQLKSFSDKLRIITSVALVGFRGGEEHLIQPAPR